MNITGIIPVKEHSVRFPGKNFQKIAGRYLINLALEKLTPVCDEVVISTDIPEQVADIITHTESSKIRLHREIQGGYGSAPLVVKALIDQGVIDDADTRILLSQVTSPLYSKYQLRDALEFFESHALNSLVAVTPDFKPCGAFYLIRRGTFEEYRDLSNPLYNPETYLYIINYLSGIDIDYEYQYHIANALYLRNFVNREVS